MGSSLADKILFLPVLWFSLICHEVGHAYAAYLAGDDTARLQGRLSFNPLHHMDPIGTVLIPIAQVFGGIPLIGWAKPVPINPMRFRAPYWRIVVALAGVTMNLILAVCALIVLKGMSLAGLLSASQPDDSMVTMLANVLYIMIVLNVILTAFNLVPIPPLDGSHILLYFIRTRDSVAFQVFSFLERFGFVILLALVVTHQIDHVLGPLLRGVARVLEWVL